MEKKKSNAALVIILLVTAALISFAPLFVLKDAEFGGADDRGNTLIEITDPDYEPWASPYPGGHSRRGASRRSRKYALLRSNRYWCGHYCLYYGTLCRTQKMDERYRK